MTADLMSAGYGLLGAQQLPTAHVDSQAAAWEGAASHYRGLDSDSRRAFQAGGDNRGADTDALNSRVTGEGGALSLAGNLSKHSSVTASHVQTIGAFNNLVRAHGDYIALVAGAVAATAAASVSWPRVVSAWNRVSRALKAGMQKCGEILRVIRAHIAKSMGRPMAYHNVKAHSMLKELEERVVNFNNRLNDERFKVNDIINAADRRARGAKADYQRSPAPDRLGPLEPHLTAKERETLRKTGEKVRELQEEWKKSGIEKGLDDVKRHLDDAEALKADPQAVHPRRETRALHENTQHHMFVNDYFGEYNRTMTSQLTDALRPFSGNGAP